MEIRKLLAVFVTFYCWHFSSGKHPSSNVISQLQHDARDAVRASRSIYSHNIQVGEIMARTGFKVRKVHKFRIKGDTFKFLIAEKGHTTMVVFRGTSTTAQLVRQLVTHIKNRKGRVQMIGGVATRINSYFVNAFNRMFGTLKPYMRSASRKYILTGHSLGGALASILSIRMTREYGGSIWKHPQSSLITFGQPRVGNKAYAVLHDKLISPWRKFRFVLRKDPVTRIPFNPNFVHHSREIYMSYDKIRSCKFFCSKKKRYYWRVCGKKDDKRCSQRRGVNIFAVGDHKSSSYVKSVVRSSLFYKNSNGQHKKSFTQAILTSC